jgi:hypothetical protein
MAVYEERVKRGQVLFHPLDYSPRRPAWAKTGAA